MARLHGVVVETFAAAMLLTILISLLVAPTQASPSGPALAAIADRVAARAFPSVFQAWSPVDNLPSEPALDTAARYDLIWNLPEFYGLRWNSPYRLEADGFVDNTVETALAARAQLLQRNPAMVLLAEVRWRDSPDGDLADASPWWQRDTNGQRILGWTEGNHYLLDWHNPEFRRQVAHQAAAIVRSGVVDGVLLDWWGAQDDDPDRLSLLEQIRQAIGPDALIMVNAGSTMPVSSAPYINGLYMETTIPSTADEQKEWGRATEALDWAAINLRTPTINAFETWTCSTDPPYAVPCAANARSNLNRMRATTTLVLTHSDGYALFADPNGLPTADHLHDWYPFWERSLGRALGGPTQRADGADQRDFDLGTAVYNPIGNAPVEVSFTLPHRSVASGAVATTFILNAFDGDLYLSIG